MTERLEIKEGAAAARPNGMPPLKDFIIFVPLLATALAVTYDVGYFTGFDINYFTFFSLNEHIVFALQVLPYAMLLCVLYLPQVFWFFKPETYEDPTFRRGKAFMRDPGQSFSRRLLNAILIWGMISLSIASAIYAASLQPGINVRNTVLLVVAMGTVLMILGTRRVVIYIVLAAAVPLLAYVLGFQQADDVQRASASHIVRTARGEKEGVLLRAGDRGLLFLDAATRRVTMIRWDGVIEVVTKEGLSTGSKP